MSFNSELFSCQVEYSWLLVFFPFNSLYHGSLSLSGLQISARKSGYSLIGVPLYVTNCFSLAFKILSLSLNIAILILIYLGVYFFGSSCL